MRTFAKLAVFMAAGLTLPAAPPRPPRRAPWVTLRTSAAAAAGGTVTETITSAYRTGR